MYAKRKDARTERINLSATPEARERIARLAERHGEQMTAWLYSYVMEKLEEDFGADCSDAAFGMPDTRSSFVRHARS